MKRKDGWAQRHFEWIARRSQGLLELQYAWGLANRPEPEPEPVSVFACGVSDVCPKNDGGPHVWDGPALEDELTSAATCSKCGVDAMTHSLWNAP